MLMRIRNIILIMITMTALMRTILKIIAIFYDNCL